MSGCCHLALDCPTFIASPPIISADVSFRIDLNKLHIEHNKYCRYDADVFPGLTYRMKVPDVVLLIFHR